ncbi:Aggrecan core protein Cartilage-specific proteoglycan core protein [Phytophthora palmivora]|uniref:Aggrecan core protein Cartilage-specific proteoglycan core protein n=1 Tax=Phytophthora palmivora TaxID=4796 RepID=A0A2P4Y8T5_9STRA|nr:Aggrecan core protein Cartilage-specific proteoglycan core protein [Phytophthora palmivora]
MRLTFLLSLIVTTFILINVGFTSAENVDNIDNGFRRLHAPTHVQEERGPGDIVAKFISVLKGGDDEVVAKLAKKFANPDSAFRLTDDEVAKMSVLVKKANAGDGVGLTDDEVAKFAKAFASAKKSAQLTDDQVIKLSKMIAIDSKKVKDAAKVSDDEVAKVSEMFKKANTGTTGGALFTDDVGKAFTAAQKEASLSDDQVSQLSKIFSNADIADDALKLTDDELSKMMGLIKKANADDGIVLADDELAKFAVAFGSAQKSAKITDDQVLKLSKMIASSKKVEEAVKVSDEEVAKVTEMFKKANAEATGKAKFTDDELAKIGKGFAAAQKGAGLSDEQVGKLAQLYTEAKQVASLSGPQIFKLSRELAIVALKDKKSWSILKKVMVGTLGVSVSAAVIYATVKLVTKDSAPIGPTTTTSSEA